MEPNSAAEDLPALYRAVLDRVAQLEVAGKRELAVCVRAEAIRIYSRAWDDRARRELEGLLRRNANDLGSQRTTGRGIRRRTIRTA
jgi:hypothetical protein